MNRYLLLFLVIAMWVELSGFSTTSIAQTVTSEKVTYSDMVGMENNKPSANSLFDDTIAEIYDLSITPTRVSPGSFPVVVAIIRNKTTSGGPGKGSAMLNIKAAITYPDGSSKVRWWNKSAFVSNQFKEFKLPGEYDSKQPGTYTVEYVIYNADKSKIYNARSRTFTVGNQPEMQTQKINIMQPLKGSAEKKGIHLGTGAYINAFNISAGPTIILWPAQSVGIQASYGIGTFKTYDIRGIYRLSNTSGLKPYVGIGYLSVERDTDVIGVAAKIKKIGGEVIVGVETPLSDQFSLFADVNANNVKLSKFITAGSQSATATVKYSPVSITIGIVYYLF